MADIILNDITESILRDSNKKFSICNKSLNEDNETYKNGIINNNIKSDLDIEIEKCSEILNIKPNIQVSLNNPNLNCSNTKEILKETEVQKPNKIQVMHLLKHEFLIKNDDVSNLCENFTEGNAQIPKRKIFDDHMPLFSMGEKQFNLKSGKELYEDNLQTTDIKNNEIIMSKNDIMTNLVHENKKIKMNFEISDLDNVFNFSNYSEEIIENNTNYEKNNSEVYSNLIIHKYKNSNCVQPVTEQILETIVWEEDSKSNVKCSKNNSDHIIKPEQSKEPLNKIETNKESVSGLETQSFSSIRSCKEKESIESKEMIFTDKLLVENMKDIASIGSDWEEETLADELCITNDSEEDILILHCEESDIDSEIDRCNEILNPTKSEEQMTSSTNTNSLVLIDLGTSPQSDFLRNESKILFGNKDKNDSKDSNKNYLDLLPAKDANLDEKKLLDGDNVFIVDGNNKTHSKRENSSEMLSSYHLSQREQIAKNKNDKVIFDSAKYNPTLKNAPENKTQICSSDRLDNEEFESIKQLTNFQITLEKNRPERIFKLAIKSVIDNEENVNLNTPPNSVKVSDTNFKNPDSVQKKVDTLKLPKKSPTKDYFEEEKEDIINPGWEEVKNLSTNEERYQQVRNCWKSRSVPDPNKNLTYHSYRKRLFKTKHNEKESKKQHKRHASSFLQGKNNKRLCTFFLDKEIDTIEQTKAEKKREIINQMHIEINSVDEQRYEKERQLCYRPYTNRYSNSSRNVELYDQFNNTISIITSEYKQIAKSCENSFRNQIGTLNERRNEVLKFYSFYKGLNDTNEDPTLLTETQFQELNEIENIYKQFNKYYHSMS